MIALRGRPGRLALAVATLLLLVVALLFDWNWFRAPLERYVSRKTERVFRIADLDVRLGLTPTIRMRDVYFGNADWGSEEAMAKIEVLEFSVSLRDLPDRILIPRVALTRPDLLMERSPDDRRNWTLADPSEDASPSRLRISTLSVDQGRLRYIDRKMPFEIDVQASTFDPHKEPEVRDANAPAVNDRYAARYAFKGRYRDAAFSGDALTGEVLSFQQSGVPFPIRGRLDAGATRLEVEGTVADAAKISGIDVQLKIKGETLANLYPFLRLPLPASPPYQLAGRLVLEGDRYAIDDLSGRIGSTDVTGSGAYVDREPRPLLTARLRSKLLDMADLGPLVGVQTQATGGKPAASQSATRNRPAAAQAQRRADPDHVLPSGTFEGSRLQQIDADVTLEAGRLKVPQALPLESLRAALKLEGGLLRIDPLDFGFAGGAIASRITLDARQPVLRTELHTTLRGVRIDRLMPRNEAVASAAGRLGAVIDLRGTGNSIAQAAAKADGRVTAAVSGGELSNLLDAVSGLNGGKVLQLLVGGDRRIPVNCGGLVADIRGGRGRTSTFVVDTEQTQILGDGGFDLGRERFEFVVTPKPKRMGILSLRTPIRVYGSFKNPEFEVQKGPLVARAGGALALAAVAPLAALLPLIETGPGETTRCASLDRQVAPALDQAQRPSARPSRSRGSDTGRRRQ